MIYYGKNPRRGKLLGARDPKKFSAFYSPRAGTMYFSQEYDNRLEAANELFQQFPKLLSVSTQRGEGLDIRAVYVRDVAKNPHAFEKTRAFGKKKGPIFERASSAPPSRAPAFGRKATKISDEAREIISRETTDRKRRKSKTKSKKRVSKNPVAPVFLVRVETIPAGEHQGPSYWLHPGGRLMDRKVGAERFSYLRARALALALGPRVPKSAKAEIWLEKV